MIKSIKVSSKWLFFILWNYYEKNKQKQFVKRLRLLAFEIFKVFNENCPIVVKD